MSVREAYCDFLLGTYDASGTSYLLTDLIADVGTAGTPLVDAQGLLIASASGTHLPKATGPLESLWGSLYDGSGFTLFIQYMCVAGASGGSELVAMDAVGGPGRADLSWSLASTGGHMGLYLPYGSFSTTFPTFSGAPNNTVWQYAQNSDVYLSVNGSSLGIGSMTMPDEPLTYGIPFGRYSSVSIGDNIHIQWLALYDANADETVFPTMSVVGTRPPPTIPTRSGGGGSTGTGSGLPMGGGIIRLRG